MKVALRSKDRTQRQFSPIEVVFVWRSWKSQGVLNPGWVGPAVVLLPEGPHAYINMQGRVWKVANEHLRPGTSEEVRGIEAVHEIFNDLKARFDRAQAKVFTPATRYLEEWCAKHMETRDRGQGWTSATHQHLQRLWCQSRNQSHLRTLNLLYRCRAQAATGEAARQTSQNTEPEGEATIAPMTQETHAAEPSTSSTSAVSVPAATMTPDQRMRAAMEATYKNDLLDDALPRRRPRATQEGGPIRVIREKEDCTSNPYFADCDLFADEVVPEPEVVLTRPRESINPFRDHWEIVISEGVLRRHHKRWRTHAFSPWEAKMPENISIRDLASARSTRRVYKSSKDEAEDDDWRAMKPSKKGSREVEGVLRLPSHA